MSEKTGVILAGGKGTRLWPTTKFYAKSMVHAYDRPMIDYPLKTLKEMGYDNAVIVSSPRGIGLVAEHVQDGHKHEMNVEYRVQPEGTTIANPIGKLALRGVFPLILGDCYYDPAPPPQTEATLFWHDYEFANEHSVWEPETNVVVEKPRVIDLGRRAIIGYYYDERIYDFVDSFEENYGRGLDISDIHNFYLTQGVNMVEYRGFFGDMGTPKGLLRVANHEASR